MFRCDFQACGSNLAQSSSECSVTHNSLSRYVFPSVLIESVHSRHPSCPWIASPQGPKHSIMLSPNKGLLPRQREVLAVPTGYDVTKEQLCHQQWPQHSVSFIRLVLNSWKMWIDSWYSVAPVFPVFKWVLLHLVNLLCYMGDVCSTHAIFIQISTVHWLQSLTGWFYNIVLLLYCIDTQGGKGQEMIVITRGTGSAILRAELLERTTRYY